MRFSTDHYFHIGHSHYTAGKPCQDHALSRSSGQIACAIVSDGCSTGGHTDMGSRILTFGTLQAIRDHANASGGALETASISITARQQQLISTVRTMLGLDRSDMLATCVYAYLTQQGALIHVQGDGVVGIKYRDGFISLQRFDWAKNAPFYPAYDEADAEVYIRKLHEGAVETAVMTKIYSYLQLNGAWGPDAASETDFKSGREGYLMQIPAEVLSVIEFIAVFTDGVTQIGRLPNGDDTLDWRKAAENFLAFKGTAGEFAKRRMIRGIKDLQQAGRGPIDDIAYAVIHVESDEVTEEVET